MPRALRHMMSPRIEAAPPLIGFPLRPSNTPKLETIREEPLLEDEDDNGRDDKRRTSKVDEDEDDDDDQ